MALQPQERFFSYNKPLDWDTGCAANLDIGEASITVRRSDSYALNRTVRSGEIEGAHALTDFAVAPGSKLYALDEQANLWVYDTQNRLTETLYRHGHRLFGERAMLAAAGDVLFIADASGERRLAAISPGNGQLVWAMQEWMGGELRPLALAADRRKHAFLLVPFDVHVDIEGRAVIPAGGRAALLEWDEGGTVVKVYEHETLRMTEPETLHSLRERFRIAVSPAGEPAIWNAAAGIVTAFRAEGAVSFAVGSAAQAKGTGFAIDGEGRFYVGGVAADSDDDPCIVKLSPSGDLLNKLRGYRGGADKLLIDGRDRMFAWDAGSGDITVLDLQSRTSELEETGLPMGVFFSSELDCTEEETVWHKIRLEADIPDETQVRISYFASDRRNGLMDGQEVAYSDYFRDSAVPLRDKLRASSRLWSEPIVNPSDALLRGAKGRYLWFKLELVGSYVHAPAVRKLRIYFPRTSLLTYLPPIYQEERGDEQFLERFLALFGTFFSEMEATIDRISSRFDPDAVGGDYLKWLSGWLAVEAAEDWDEPKLRELMRQAPDLYKRRGTREGLIRMLRIYTGKEPFIVEYHQVKAMQEASELRLLFERLYGDNPYCFTVMLPPECVRSDKQRLMIEVIIDDQKPAYAEGQLIVLEPWMYADVHTYLGINTVLSEPTLLTLGARSAMPYQTLLTDFDRDRRMDVHTRLELDSELE